MDRKVWVKGNEHCKNPLQRINSQEGEIIEEVSTPSGRAYKVLLADGRIDLVSADLISPLNREQNPLGIISKEWNPKSRKFEDTEERNVYFRERKPTQADLMNQKLGDVEDSWVDWQGIAIGYVFYQKGKVHHLGNKAKQAWANFELLLKNPKSRSKKAKPATTPQKKNKKKTTQR